MYSLSLVALSTSAPATAPETTTTAAESATATTVTAVTEPAAAVTAAKAAAAGHRILVKRSALGAARTELAGPRAIADPAKSCGPLRGSRSAAAHDSAAPPSGLLS